MKLLAQSPDGTLMCCANETHLKFVDSRFLKLYETNTPGAIMAASFHPQKYELFLKIDSRTLVAKSPAPPLRALTLTVPRSSCSEPLAGPRCACLTTLRACRFLIWTRKSTASKTSQIQ